MKKQRIDAIIVKRLDEEQMTIELRSIEDKLATYYEIINCTTIDIVQRQFSGVEFDVVCDDWGLIKAQENGELPTSIWAGKEHLYGVLVLTHHDDQGNLTSATSEDVIHVRFSMGQFHAKKEDIHFVALRHDLERRII